MRDQQLVDTALVFLVALLNSGILAVVGLALRRWATAKWGMERVATMTALATEAVRAAEQIAAAHGMGSADKYRYAAEALQHFAQQHHITIDPDQLRVLIESAVHQLTQSQQLGAAGDPTPLPVAMTTGEQRLAPAVRHFSGKTP